MWRVKLTYLNLLVLYVLRAGAAPPAVVLGQLVLIVYELSQTLHLRRALLPPLYRNHRIISYKN